MKTNVIETIGTLNELKAYCCPKVAGDKEWYLRCIECKSLKYCSCGKRAVELLNQQTRPDIVNKWNDAAREQARKEYESVLKTGDPVHYLMASNGMSHDNAMAKLSRWRAKYPDIAEKYTHTTFNAHTLKLEERIANVFSSDDPIAYLMNNDGLSYQKARATLSRWSIDRPDLDEKYHIREYMAKTRKDASTMKKAASYDEVSVEDFLMEQKEEAEPQPSLQEEREMFTEALKSEDPIGYIAEAMNSDRKKASNKLGKLREKHPDILQRIGYVRKHHGPTIAAALRKQQGMENAEKAFSAQDPVIYVMKKFGRNEANAKYYISRWAEKYPELAEKYHIPEYLMRIENSRVLEKAPEKKDDAPVDITPVSRKSEESTPNDVLLKAVNEKKEQIRKDIQDLKNQIAFLESQAETLNKTYYILTGKVPE